MNLYELYLEYIKEYHITITYDEFRGQYAEFEDIKPYLKQ